MEKLYSMLGIGSGIVSFSEKRPALSTLVSMSSGWFVVPIRNTRLSGCRLLISVRNYSTT